MESESLCLEVAERMISITDKLGIPYIFKASFRKANRTSLNGFTGIGDLEGLRILKKVADTFNIPVLTDVHESSDCAMAAEYVDVLQIPAFLCRQTELLLAAGETGKVVNIKKGQFLNATSMKFAVEKVKYTGNEQVWLTERGNTFGYGDLVVDYRNLPEMRNYAPTVMDITHSLQQPNQAAGVTGGKPELIETIAKAAVATGIDGIFLETHPDPSKALSDGANMIALHNVEALLEKLIRIHQAIS